MKRFNRMASLFITAIMFLAPGICMAEGINLIFSEARFIPSPKSHSLKDTKSIDGYKLTIEAKVHDYYASPAHQFTTHTAKGIVTKVEFPEPVRTFVEYKVRFPESCNWKSAQKDNVLLIYDPSNKITIGYAYVPKHTQKPILKIRKSSGHVTVDDFDIKKTLPDNSN